MHIDNCALNTTCQRFPFVLDQREMTSPVACHFTQLMPIEHEIICYSIFYHHMWYNESAIVSPNFSMSLIYGQLSKKSFWLAKELMIWLSKREQTKTFCVTKDRRRETKGFWNCIFNFFSLGTYLYQSMVCSMSLTY